MRLLTGICLLILTPAALAGSEASPITSPDGRFAWDPGAPHVLRLNPRTGKKDRRLKLPALIDEKTTRKVLFAEKGRYFCVVDEKHSEVGLHLKTRRGAKAAKAIIISSTLHLIDDDGRTAWTRRLRDKHSLVKREGLPPQVVGNGTLAVLLEDADRAHVNPKPLLLVLDPKGKEKLRLDYLNWRRVDEFKLSPEGSYLAVRGYGRIEDEENWDLALALYEIGSKRKIVKKARISKKGEAFESVSDDGRVCCAAVNGGRRTMDILGKLHAEQQ
jgi:hypothetical protein